MSPFPLALLLIMLWPGHGQTATPPEYSQQQTTIASKSEKVVIHNPWGDIRLRDNGLPSRFVVLQTLQGSGLKLQYREDEHGLEIQVVAESADIEPGQALPRMDLSLRVPRQRVLEASTHAGLIEARGLHNDLTLRTVSGNIVLNKIHGPIQAHSDTGVVRATLLENVSHQTQRFSSRQRVEVWIPQPPAFRVELTTLGQVDSPFPLRKQASGWSLSAGSKNAPLLQLFSETGTLVLRGYPRASEPSSSRQTATSIRAP